MIQEAFAGYMTDFGEAVVFGTSTTTAIFDLPSAEFSDVIVNDPRLYCISTEVSSVASGQSAIVRGVSYTVRTVEPDGTGLTIMTLTTP